MKKQYTILLGLIACAGCLGTQTAVELHPALHRTPDELALQQENYEGDIYPFFEEYCFSCHGDRKQKGSVNLEAVIQLSSVGKDESTWERVLAMLQTSQMPPEDEDQPSDFDREDVAGFIETELDTQIKAMRPDPGTVTARRLNRQEYNNTIRDLLGVVTNPSGVFPVDDSGYGFDNIGDVLTLSPILLEMYLSAAEDIVQEAITHELDSTDNTHEEEQSKRFLFICGHNRGEHEKGCSNTILRQFAARAYRRPVTKDEIQDLQNLVTMVQNEGDSLEKGIEIAIEAVLVSPKFLFRVEHGQNTDPSTSVQYINDFELASRLSYFLWSTMPDEELFTLARKGILRKPKVLNAQLERMIADEKAWELVSNFAGQWLQLRNLPLTKKDRLLFPEYNTELRTAMNLESYMFFSTILRDNMSVLNFIDSDFTFVNEHLANHYGIEGIEGKEHRRITLEGDQRGGVLTQGSVLTLTSYRARTSPVARGAWVMENILGTKPPPPPEEVPPLPTNPQAIAKLTGTLREQFEQHRADPGCASCHKRIDPIGFGLENYDTIGRWRTEERGYPVDSTGVLPTGETFEGSAELKKLLIKQPDNFIRCFTEKMLTYALGRGIEDYDRPVVAAIEERIAKDDYKFHTLIREIVMSVPFQMRRSDGEENV